MSVDAVWRSLPELGWATTKSIREASGIDEHRLNAILNFLIRWKFVETRANPTFSVRRKAGARSPVVAFGVLRTFTDIETSLGNRQRQVNLAERVACRECGGRSFKFLKQNLVECNQCHERQWYAIKVGTPNWIQKPMGTIDPARWIGRILGRQPTHTT